VEHLFISCHFARLLWRVVFAAYNILTKVIKIGFTLVFRLCVGQFGIAEMILCLTKKTLLIF
jgi:hypothetical protein